MVCYFTKSRLIKCIGVLLMLALAYVGIRLVEYTSFKILVAKKILPADGIVHPEIFGTKLSLWQGGLDNSCNGYYFRGYNDSLQLGELTFIDLFGFAHGDSLPFKKEKSPSTIRVVLTGGSGMKGNLQTWSIVNMYYPEGCYDYATSIAGKLKRRLQAKEPAYKWEVINAAVVMHQFNQSFAAYYEKIHDVHPDIIVNMDGYNDGTLSLDFLTQGDPYLTTDNQINQALDLEVLKRSSNWGYTYMLLNYYMLQIGREEEKKENMVTMPDKGKPLNPNFPIVSDSFSHIAPLMKKNMEKQLWLIDAYESQLQRDSVFSIFCFQPILDRQFEQKKLSKKELALKAAINDEQPINRALFDSITPKFIGKYPVEMQNAFDLTGDSKCFIMKYHHHYFINQYISPAIDSIVTLHQGAYIDLGKEMVTLSDSVEFYMDYTHTTPFGNAFIAEQIEQRVAAWLQKRK